MTKVVNFYLDDSGTRHPTRKVGNQAAHGYDWFALGGVLVVESEEPIARELYSTFCDKWQIEKPLHSSEIRSKNENFDWLRKLDAPILEEFYEELYFLMKQVPLIGLACVVDRNGYNVRYSEKYNKEPWLLCKTAFGIVVERAAKYARTLDARLRVLPEKCNRVEDSLLKTYYSEMKTDGLPFDKANSDKYEPLLPEDFNQLLYELKFKNKTSPLAQLADLFLWPICIGGYHRSNRTYKQLLNDGKLIECRLTDLQKPLIGSKYSCFDYVEIKP